MNRHTALYARIGALALGISILAAPTASAYPVRDFDPPCPSEAARTSVAQLASRYARYLSRGRLRLRRHERQRRALRHSAGGSGSRGRLRGRISPLFMDDRG